VNDELENVWKEVVVAKLEVLPQQKKWLLFRPRIEARIS
jgi:hypothetical protein